MANRTTGEKKSLLPKGKKKKIFYLAYVLVIAFLAIILMPNSRLHSMQINVRTIVTTLGIDKAGEEYELTAQIIIPQENKQEPEIQAVVSSKGITIRKALDGIAVKTGRITNMSHCRLVILGKELSEDNVTPALDYFIRSVEIDSGISVVAAKTTAKETIDTLKNFDKTSAFALSEFLTQNYMNNLGTSVILSEFMEDFYSDKGNTYLPLIEIKKKDAAEQEGGGGEGGGGGTAGEPKAEIGDKFETAVFSFGKMVKALKQEETRALLWMDPKVQRGRVVLEDIQHPQYKGAKASLSIYKKKRSIKTSFKDGKPRADINITLKLNLDEIEKYELPPLLKYEESYDFNEEINDKVERQIRSDISGLKQECAAEGLDILKLERLFFKRHNKAYKEYMKTHSSEELVKECELNIKVKTRVNF